MSGSNLSKTTEKLTFWLGTPTSIVVHTLFFIGVFALSFFGINTEDILLILTTAVSLEAIYLAIFIQMSVNRQIQSIAGVEQNIEEIQEDVEDIQEDVQGLETDVEEISEDVEDITEDLDEISSEENVDKKEATAVKRLEEIEKQLHQILEKLESTKK